MYNSHDVQHIPGTYDAESKLATFRINQIRYAGGNPVSTFVVPEGLDVISVKKAMASDESLLESDFRNRNNEVMADGWMSKDASDKLEAFGPNVPLVVTARLNLTGAKIDENVEARDGSLKDFYMLDFTVVEVVHCEPFDGNELPDGTLPIRRTTADERANRRNRRLNAPGTISGAIPEAPAPTTSLSPF